MKNKVKRIDTKRLVLKEITLNDQKEFVDIVSNKEVSKTYMLPIFNNEEEKIKLFERFILLSKKEDRFVYGIYLNSTLIGFINDVEIKEYEIELGYVIDPKHKNNGYATEVLVNSINVLFDMGYKTIKAGAFINNLASIKVMEKANMIKTSIIDTITYNGKEYTCVNYIMNKKDNTH